MKRKLALLIALFTTMVNVSTYGASDISILVDGEMLSFENDQEPVIEQGRTLVPFRAVFEAMGAEVNWDGDLQRCQASFNGKNVSTTIGDYSMYVYDLLADTDSAAMVELDVCSKIINGRTMVPLRALSEGLGLEVDWDNDTRIITISTKDKMQVGNYTYYTADYESFCATDDGTNYIYASGSYPQFEGEGFIPSLNTHIENMIKKDIDSFAASYKEDALKAYTNATEHLFEPPYNYSVYCELSAEGDVVSVNVSRYEVQYGQDDKASQEVIKINMQTGEIVE